LRTPIAELFIANNSAYGPPVWNNTCLGTNGITFTAGDKMIYVEVRPHGGPYQGPSMDPPQPVSA